ncbi:MAG: 3-hydroxybutyryl-CoA dehydrogenase [Deltaproteobacteria bacterium]|nr:3-hydroxybutyryl-CoA dehydrogenase [Deltaproteobacteria bacterium]
MEIKKIGVVEIGCEVVLRDIEDAFVERGIKNIDRFLSRSVEKGKMEASEKEAVLARIKGTTNMADLADVDFVIEAVLEVMDLKKKVFQELDEICRPGVVLASNTSSMSLTEIAAATKRPEKVCGMHFFNPVPLMRLVEVIRGHFTDDETVAATTELAKKMGKVTVEIKKDSPGFIVNRIMIPHMIEAIKIVEEGIATIEDVDIAVKAGLNYPMGPFELMDLTGIDICFNVAEYFYQELNKESKWVTPTLFKTMIRAGKLGRKTGAGWYEYGKK